ncbi:hypothetical protein GCM10023339_07050 [Alloalcanivorax gelatiniphagus]
MTIDRRTLVRGAAWTVPALAVSAHAPAYAASLCQPVPFQVGWRVTNSGATTFNGDRRAFVTAYPDAVERYLSEADNSRATAESVATNSSTITVERDLTLVAGRPYTFTFTIASRFSGDNSSNSQNQHLQIQTVAGGNATDRLKLVKGSRDSTHFGNLTNNGWSRLQPLTAPPGGVNVETRFFTYTPPAGVGTVVLRYLFTLPARGYGFNNTFPGQADIAVSAPTISGEGC